MIEPSEALMQDCLRPEVKIDTNEDLARSFVAMREAFNQCDARYSALRAFVRQAASIAKQNNNQGGNALHDNRDEGNTKTQK